jgi:hypothetical protein
MSNLARGIALSICLCSLGSAGLAGELPPMTQGQTVYVPVYSEVLHGDKSGGKPDRWLLSATLAIRNTDLKNSLMVLSLRYYDTDGKLLREYPAGKKLGPLATMEVFIEHKDKSGGSGANFLVEWDAGKPINPPIIEAVHTYFFGTRSVVFTSPGQPLHVEDR